MANTISFNIAKNRMWEVVIGHVLIFFASGVVYLLAGKVSAIVFFIVIIFSEMVGFHILWIWCDNQDHDRPLLFAIGVESVYLIIGTLLALSVVLFSLIVHNFFPISLFAILIIIMFVIIPIKLFLLNRWF